MSKFDDLDDPNFRAALEEATQASNPFELGAITTAVERIAAQYQRHVFCLRCSSRTLPPIDPASPRLNCHAYSLDLYTTPQFQAALNAPESEFLEHLINRQVLLDRAIDAAQDGDLVVYRSSGRITHSGRISGLFVHSKWGEGSLFEHTPLAVPASYGSELHVFQPPLREQVAFFYANRWPAA